MAQWQRTHLPKQETQVQSLDREGPLEKEVATHSNILAWEIPWTEEPGRTTVHGVTESDTSVQLNLRARRAHTHSQSGGLQLLELTFPFLRVEQINLPTG